MFVGPVGSGKSVAARSMALALGLDGTAQRGGHLEIPVTDVAGSHSYLDLCLSLTANGCLILTDLHNHQYLWGNDLTHFVDVLRRTMTAPSVFGKRLLVLMARTERDAQKFLAKHPDLAWVFPTPPIRFEPLSDQALARRFQGIPEATAVEMVGALRARPGWAGMKTIENTLAILPWQALSDEERFRARIPTSGFDQDRVDEILSRIHGLVGVDGLKDAAAEIVATAKVNDQRSRQGRPRLTGPTHMSFLGDPGTGKTTAAHLIGELLHACGVTNQADVVEVTRADLVGEYIGQTAPTVRAVHDRSKGGVLFIDEAYALTPQGPTDFANEAIAELVALMEQDRSTVVIFAGYPEPMDDFIETNPGLRSRIGRIVTFDPLTVEERVHVFAGLAEQHQIPVTDEALQQVAINLTVLDALDYEGGARLVRVLFERACARHALRVGDRYADGTEITIDDLERLSLAEVRDVQGLGGYV